jgi:hypothetical protein
MGHNFTERIDADLGTGDDAPGTDDDGPGQIDTALGRGGDAPSTDIRAGPILETPNLRIEALTTSP